MVAIVIAASIFYPHGRELRAAALPGPASPTFSVHCTSNGSDLTVSINRDDQKTVFSLRDNRTELWPVVKAETVWIHRGTIDLEPSFGKGFRMRINEDRGTYSKRDDTERETESGACQSTPYVRPPDPSSADH